MEAVKHALGTGAFRGPPERRYTCSSSPAVARDAILAVL